MRLADIDTTAFTKGVDKTFDRVKRDAYTELVAVGEQAASTAKSLARRDSGRMADSIKATPGVDLLGPYTDVTVDPFYASFEEFGREGDPGQPFIRPSTAQAAKRLRRRP